MKTNELKRRESRKRRRDIVAELADPVPSTSTVIVSGTEGTETSGSETYTDDEFLPAKSSLKRFCPGLATAECDAEETAHNSLTKTKSLPFFAEACDRVVISDRGAALISTSLLEDIGVLKKSSSDNIIDRHKVHRERVHRRQDHSIVTEVQRITSVYFDGKRDVSLVNKKDGGKYYKKKVSEEHICLISEPGATYVGHFAPINGTSRSIHQGIMEFAKNNSISFESLIAIGCDGTNVNTGTKGGVIKLMEDSLGRPVHWFICMLHANELPLRHLFSSLDGKTSGPRCFTGPVGKLLQKCESRSIVNFAPISVPLITTDKRDISTDQKYLLEIHQAVSSGVVSKDLAKRSPGSLNHARWLTTAYRILRLYVSTEDPTHNLKTLANFLMEVYIPMWFNIKSNPHVKFGAKHIYETLRLMKAQTEEVQTIVLPVLQGNAYFVHPESVLLAMVTDERQHVRELAWRRIKYSRVTTRPASEHVRQFQIPQLLLDCNEYYNMILWQSTNVTEPPITMGISDQELDEYIKDKHLFVIEKYPLHTQAVERAIKIVSEASNQVCGHETREGFIKSRLASRGRISVFESKKDYPIL